MGRAARRGGWLVLVLLAPAWTLHAQDRAPELRDVPAAVAPHGVPAGPVELIAEVDPEGRARVTACEDSAARCEVARRAVEASSFAPARRGDRPIRAHVRLRLRLVRASAPPADPYGDVPPDPSAALGVDATVAVERAGARALDVLESRDMPGTLGDPLRALLTLPGVVPAVDGLPYFYVRGAPPSGTIFVYDSIPVPSLFHLAAGPAVVHPRMLGDLQMTNGVAEARYGRHSGGVIVSGAPAIAGTVGELELRTLDASGFVSAQVDSLQIAAAARVGWPGAFVSAVLEEVELSYWDAQVRGAVDVGRGHRFELVALGAHDVFRTYYPDFDGALQSATEIAFQRTELRWVLERGATEVGSALRFGFDRSSYAADNALFGGGGGLGVQLFTFGARTWLAHRTPHVRLRFGAESYGAAGRFFDPEPSLARLERPVLFPVLDEARQRSTAAVYAQLEWRPFPWLRVDAGARGDLFVTPGRYEAAVDPRLRIAWTPTEQVTLHVAGGVARQPSVFLVPLPGLSDLPLRFGLQTAIQSEYGVRVDAEVDDVSLSIDARAFLHRYENLLFNDVFSDDPPVCTEEGLCRAVAIVNNDDPVAAVLSASSAPSIDMTAAGTELGLTAGLGPHVRARAAYTLTLLRSDGFTPLGTVGPPAVPYTPTYDVRHVMHLVLAYDSQDGFSAGLRGFLRSGTAPGFLYLTDDLALHRYVQRLDWFGRLDASVAYAWDAGWARLRVSLDWRNLTFAAGGEPFGLLCEGGPGRPSEPCPVDRLPAIFFPNLGIRGAFE